MRKICALLLSIVMVMGLAVTASADGTATTQISIKDQSNYNHNRTYIGFKILEASVDGENFAYKVNDDYRDVLCQALNIDVNTADSDIIQKISEHDEADEILHLSTNLYRKIKASGLGQDYPANGTTWNGGAVSIEQGYWLIADTTDLDGTPYSNSLVMVDTIGDTSVEINNKPDAPVAVKKVDDEDDSVVDPVSNNEDGANWNDTADYDIGDNVPFMINGQLPNDVMAYKYYKLMIVDEVDQGLTFDTNTFAVTVNGTSRTIGSHGSTGKDFWYTLDNDNNTLYVYPAHGYVTNDGTEMQASKDNGGNFQKLFPENTPHSEINNATFSFRYECTLNSDATVGSNGNRNHFHLVFSNDPYGDADGETTDDVNVVFTFKSEFHKTDKGGNPLSGADFDLYKFVAKKGWTEADRTNAKTLDELKTNEAFEAAFINGDMIYHDVANACGHFQKLNKTTNDDEYPTEFYFTGMDAGHYRLVETNVPTGYNGINPVDFQVHAEHAATTTDGNNALDSLTVTTRIAGSMAMTNDSGTLKADIQNHSGSELPSTGGIGTTLFYVIGGILFAGAVVLLITKKRMSS